MTRETSTIIRICLLLSAALLLTACFNREREPVYVDSQEVDPIEAPPGLTQPQPRTTYEVPGHFLPELAAQGNEEKPPQVLSSAEAERSRSHIRFGRTGLYLEVEDEPDSVWRRLGFSLNRAGMDLQEADEEDRRYRFRFSHEPMVHRRSGWSRLAFWRGTEVIDYSGVYVAEVEQAGNGSTRVALFGPDGNVVDMEQAEFVLARLRERLG